MDAWAERPLDQEYPFLLLDAMHLEVRRQEAVRSTAVLLAIGIGEDGQREILGIETALGETGKAWQRFIRRLKDRGLSGVELATSDAHTGLKKALKESFPGLIWQRCQAHFKRNVMNQAPASYKDRMDQVLDPTLRTRKMAVMTMAQKASFSAQILPRAAMLAFDRRGREVLESSSGQQITIVCLIVQPYWGMLG